MARLPAEERPEELNMTPMIDVVFQLLIFFMLTMKFTEVEGKLLSTMPKDKNISNVSPRPPELQEIRIVVCADSRNECGGVTAHLHDKGRHDAKGVRKDASVCRVFVEMGDIGDLARGRDNRAVLRAAARKAKDLVDITPSSRDPQKRAAVILDADSETPYEHIIGIVDACKAAGIENLEFVGNARFEKYFDSARDAGSAQHKYSGGAK